MKPNLFLFAFLFALVFNPLSPQLRSDKPGLKPFQQDISSPFSAFLPVVTTTKSSQAPVPDPVPAPVPPSGPASVLGVEATLSFGLDDMPEPDTGWVRLNGVLWSNVEPRRGERNWAALAAYEPEWKYIAEQGKNLVLVVRSTPPWAQKFPGYYCGQIKPEELKAFAQFMHDLVARYSAPPYSIKYWQIWNEPDVAPALVAPDSVYGCWGDSGDANYGGGYFAEMLKAVYPAIKAADPQAQVILGGLLLDCNPRVSGGCRDPKERPPRFLIGILENGGGPYFDGVGFHAYDSYEGMGRYARASWRSSWDTTGPSLIAKARYLQQILDENGVTGKYLIATEAAMTKNSGPCDGDCQLTKAYYVPQLYAATLAEGIRATIWYSLTGDWRNVMLFDAAGKPLPAYTAYSVAWDQFAGATFSAELDLGSGLRGYELNRGGDKLWVVWAVDIVSHTIQVPGELVSVTDVFGKPELAAGDNVTVRMEPLYIHWRP